MDENMGLLYPICFYKEKKKLQNKTLAFVIYL